MPYDTKEEILKLGEIDGEFEAFLKQANLPPMDYSNLDQFKSVAEERMTAALDQMGEPGPGIKKSETSYNATDGTKMRALLFQPDPLPEGGAPLIVMIHGGGFCIGGPEGEEQSCRSFVQAFGAVCVSLSYRLGPQYKFPYAVTDCWDGLRWAAKSASSWGVDPKNGFVVGGTSAGGNLTAVLTHMARDEGLQPPLTGQYLSIPALCPQKKLPGKYKHLSFSHEQNKSAPVLPQAAIDMFMDGYKPDDDDERYAVFNHSKGHKDLPSAYFQICGLDPLRDEALIYEKVLREECGTKTKFDVYSGLPHGYWSFFPMLKSSNKFREEMVVGVGWLLGKKPDLAKADTDAKESIV